MRDRRFVGLAELNEALFEQVDRLNAAPFDKREDSRRVVFLRDEAPLLAALPPARFELAKLSKAKVAPNYHVQVDGCFYSVPSRLIGQTLDVRATTTLVEVFAGAERVATHPKLAGKGRYATVPEHMPHGHREYLKDWTPQRFEAWAASVGPATLAVVRAILASRPIVEQSYRSCLGVMGLAKRPGGHTRLEQSCARALDIGGNLAYTTVKRLWSTWQADPPEEPSSLADKGFVRGASYYAKEAQR